MPQPISPAAPARREVERRGQRRFDVALNLRYTISARKRDSHGTGRTINMSSSGILFRSSGYPAAGRHIDLWIDWPAGDAMGKQLVLHVSGFIVRTQGHRAAISIARYQLVPATANEEAPQPSPALPLRETPPPKRVYRPHAGIFLIIENERTASAFAAILSTRGHAVQIAQPDDARRILTSGFPPVRLVVTNTLSALNGLKVRVPVIYTMEHADTSPALDGLETVTILRKPLIYGEVRQVINRLLPPIPDIPESE